MESVSFEIGEPRKYMDEARRLAVIAAKEKANAMARELDAGIGKVHSISESGTLNIVTGLASNASVNGGGVGTSSAFGQMNGGLRSSKLMRCGPWCKRVSNRSVTRLGRRS